MTLITSDLDRRERERIRLAFFREFRGEDGCASVSVRRDQSSHAWSLKVGYTGSGERLPREFEGLAVEADHTPRAVHAVQYRN